MRFPFWLLPILAGTLLVVFYSSKKNKKDLSKNEKNIVITWILYGLVALVVGLVFLFFYSELR